MFTLYIVQINKSTNINIQPMAAVLGLRAMRLHSPMELLIETTQPLSPPLLISIMTQEQAAGPFIQIPNHLQALSNTLIG